jgi:uncharacterized protein
MNEMITRSFEIRATDAEKREVSGMAVPFNQTIDIGGGWSERFEKGAVDLDTNVKLFRDHKDIIGVVTEMEESDEGLLIRAKISETVLGNETLNLVKDGAIRSFSVGFIPVKDEKKDNTIIRKKVNLKEVSLVAFPAYDKAEVLSVREETNQEEISMENTTPDYTSAIEEVRNHAEELERRLDVIASEKTPSVSVPQFRSYGAYVKAVASGDLDAYRVFTGADSADSIMKDQWVSDTVRIVNNGRPTFNLFSSGTLPADGMNVEYPKISSNSLDVAAQAAEGDVLATGKLILTSATEPIKTYGGYTEMSRQVVERSSINYVDTAFRAMVAKYAAVTNAAAIAKVYTSDGDFNQVTLASFDTDDVLEALADAAVKVNQETGLPLQALVVGATTFKNLAKAVDGSNRPLLSNVGATQNTFGSINPLGLTGNILGLPVVLDPALNATAMYAWNAAALTSYESSGAPFRLNDEEITALTNSFSVYGYLALTCQEPKAAVIFNIA